MENQGNEISWALHKCMWPRLSYGQWDVNRVSHDTSGKPPYKEIFTRSSPPLSFIFSALWDKEEIHGAPAAIQNHKDERKLSKNQKRPRLLYLKSPRLSTSDSFMWVNKLLYVKLCMGLCHKAARTNPNWYTEVSGVQKKHGLSKIQSLEEHINQQPPL